MSTSNAPISIIVPTLNESENVAPLVSHIVATGVPIREILFVDGGSTDGTRDLFERLRQLIRSD